MNKPTSFSQSTLFKNCQLSWYYKYIKKIPIYEDMCYAEAGNVIHKILEKYYNNKELNIEELKQEFNNLWKEKKLEDSKISLKKDEYWLMILNGKDLNVNITSTELKIFYSDVVGYIDGVNTTEDIIIDWKSSTRRKENEEEYTEQLKFYSYLYKRKFKRLPKKATVYYLKYNGTKGELSFTPTEDDVKEMEAWHEKTCFEINEIRSGREQPKRCETCFFFCPYKNICKQEQEERLEYTLHINDMFITIEGKISQLLNTGLAKKFGYELKDSFFIKRNNPNANTRIDFWNQRKQTLPLGFYYGLLKTLNDYAEYKKIPINIKTIDHRIVNGEKVKMPEQFLNGIKLRDYQKEAVQKFLEKKIGILEIGTGGGKTLCAAECIRRLGYKTLFVVDKIELLKQTKKRMQDALGIEIGQLGGGVEEFKDVTVATIQTLIKNVKDINYIKYFKSVRFVIFDETHKVAARSYVKIGRMLSGADYRLGISGTAFRDDGNDMMINAVTGYKLYDLSSKVLIEKGWLVRPTIRFIKDYMREEDVREIKQKSSDRLEDGTPENYLNYYQSFIVENDKRNDIIYRLTEDNKDKKILILVKLIDHGNLLEKMIPGSRYLHGSIGKKEREDMFEQFVDGSFNVLISTISIFSEGIDIPSLDMVINASANKGDVKTIQVLGRILRKMEGKDDALYMDFMDNERFFEKASMSRRRALLREGHKVEVSTKEHIL